MALPRPRKECAGTTTPFLIPTDTHIPAVCSHTRARQTIFKQAFFLTWVLFLVRSDCECEREYFLRRPTRKGKLCYCECAGREESKGKLYKIHNKRRGENRNRSRFLPFEQAGIVNSKAKRRFFNVKRSKWIGLQSSRSMLMLHFTHFHTSFEKDFYTFLLLPFRHMGSGSLRSNFLYYVQYFFPFSLPSTLSVWAYPAIRFPSSHLWLFLHDQKPGWRRRTGWGWAK